MPKGMYASGFSIFSIISLQSAGKTYVEGSFHIFFCSYMELKVSAFGSLVKCEVKVTLDGLFSSMYLDSSRKKMCLYFGPKLKSRLCS